MICLPRFCPACVALSQPTHPASLDDIFPDGPCFEQSPMADNFSQGIVGDCFLIQKLNLATSFKHRCTGSRSHKSSISITLEDDNLLQALKIIEKKGYAK